MLKKTTLTSLMCSDLYIFIYLLLPLSHGCSTVSIRNKFYSDVPCHDLHTEFIPCTKLLLNRTKFNNRLIIFVNIYIFRLSVGFNSRND